MKELIEKLFWKIFSIFFTQFLINLIFLLSLLKFFQVIEICNFYKIPHIAMMYIFLKKPKCESSIRHFRQVAKFSLV